MRRRDFLKVAASGVAAWPFSATAQQSAMPFVGYFSAGSASDDARPMAAFIKGLGEAGY